MFWFIVFLVPCVAALKRARTSKTVSGGAIYFGTPMITLPYDVDGTLPDNGMHSKTDMATNMLYNGDVDSLQSCAARYYQAGFPVCAQLLQDRAHYLAANFQN